MRARRASREGALRDPCFANSLASLRESVRTARPPSQYLLPFNRLSFYFINDSILRTIGFYFNVVAFIFAFVDLALEKPQNTSLRPK